MDDYADYGGANGIQVCSMDGTAGPAGYKVGVQIVSGSGGIVTGAIPNGDTREITITVRNGANSYQLVGWRTNFGGG